MPKNLLCIVLVVIFCVTIAGRMNALIDVSGQQAMAEEPLFSLNCMVSAGAIDLMSAASIWREDLAKIGVELDITTVESGAISSRQWGSDWYKTFDEGGWDTTPPYCGGWWYMDPVSLAWYESCYTQLGWLPYGYNYYGWNNAQADHILETVLYSMNETLNTELMRQWQEIYVTDPAQLITFTDYGCRFHRASVTGWMDLSEDLFNKWYFLHIAEGHSPNVNIAISTEFPAARGWNPLIMGVAGRGVYAPLWSWYQLPDGKAICKATLVDSYEWSEDLKDFTMRLCKNATWSDGYPFTADDIVCSINAILDPELGSIMASDLMPVVDSVEKIDDHTVTLHLKKTCPIMISLLSDQHFYVVPDHILGNILHSEWKTHPSHTSTDPSEVLPGLGPYKFKSWTIGQSWSFELRDPDKPASEGGLKGYMEAPDDAPRRITYFLIPEATTALAALEKGEVDSIDIWMSASLFSEIERLKKEPDIMISTFEKAAFGFAGVNCRHPILINPHVRVALWHAIDRPRIRDEVYFELPKIQHTPLCPCQPYYDPNIKSPEFSLEKAAAELRLAGYPEWPRSVVIPMSFYYLPIAAGLIIGAVIGSLVIYAMMRRRITEEREIAEE